MDENMLSLLEQQSPFFMGYVKQFPALELQVIADASVAFLAFALSQSGDNPPFEQLVAGRDGAFRLCGVADGAGFADVASFFYGCYEVLCGQIAFYQG
jgi:hypothetical protein